MNLTPATELKYLKGVGPQRAAAFWRRAAWKTSATF